MLSKFKPFIPGLLFIAVTAFGAGCGKNSPLANGIAEVKFEGELTTGPENSDLGLIAGKHLLSFQNEGKRFEFKSVGGAESTLKISLNLNETDLNKINVQQGEGHNGEYPQGASITLSGQRIQKPFNMGIMITKKVVKTRVFVQTEECTTTCLNFDGEVETCDGEREVTYREDTGYFNARIGFTPAGAERDNTIIANFTSRSRLWENTYEIDRTMCN